MPVLFSCVSGAVEGVKKVTLNFFCSFLFSFYFDCLSLYSYEGSCFYAFLVSFIVVLGGTYDEEASDEESQTSLGLFFISAFELSKSVDAGACREVLFGKLGGFTEQSAGFLIISIPCDAFVEAEPFVDAEMFELAATPST